MKIVRPVLIVLLLTVNIYLIGFAPDSIKEPSKELSPENITVRNTIEQTESMEHPEFKKAEYTLVLPEGTNIALKKKVIASSFADVYTPRKTTDGIAVGVSYWEGKPDYPNYLTVDLEKKEKFQAIRLALSPMAVWGKRTQTIAVNISKDGETFTPLAEAKQYTFDPDLGNEAQLFFDNAEARYIQLVFTENTGSGGGQLAEFEIYQK
ncbi:discoidin domain-containing protein [Anaerocolumna sp. AGMB13020]|uniref:discoidin domain-containing protein n=1 Tax=Anaerocolumna sp. AGMB13020 TaxID=3081750 RepID=UPI002952AC2A|nr:discoidin domain-containing protein [Anaerocolumna sp. AGMB13020]WOO36261.1 discoidin domain-containing protein [Anaerocolumna sp. AGMB13020]